MSTFKINNLETIIFYILHELLRQCWLLTNRLPIRLVIRLLIPTYQVQGQIKEFSKGGRARYVIIFAGDSGTKNFTLKESKIYQKWA